MKKEQFITALFCLMFWIIAIIYFKLPIIITKIVFLSFAGTILFLLRINIQELNQEIKE